MSNTGSQPNQFVLLHIADSFETAEAGAVEQWASQSGLEVERCGDVYSGLARALKNSQSSPMCVAVCVAGMPPEQFEFFELASRARRDLTVLVYSARSPERVVRALQSGASGLASREAIAGLAARIKRTCEVVEAQPSTIVHEIETMEPVKTLRHSEQPGAAVAKPAEMQPDPCIDDRSSGDTLMPGGGSADAIVEQEPRAPVTSQPGPDREERPSDQEVRVPWLRYDGGPARQKPAPPPDSPVNTTVPAEANKKEPSTSNLLKDCEDDENYEPLLSEQELAALLGDDFDDVAAREREMLTGDNETPGGGAR